MRVSAGLMVVFQDKILLVQQQYDNSRCHMSIPKGFIHDNEPFLDAAIRETYEETGLLVHRDEIDTTPHVININNEKFQRRIIYYIVKLKCVVEPTIKPLDTSEITWAGFVEHRDAVNSIQISQLSILFHLRNNYVEPRMLNFLLLNDYLTREKHPSQNLYIYNYTDKCKKEEYWNEITLWARGIILDASNNVIAKPLKKFFEYHQIYDGFIPDEDYEILEKKDGALGILYWVNEMPFITTRSSFVLPQALKATMMLYTNYADSLINLNKDYSYFFEIIYPESRFVIDYKNTTDLFLIGAFDNKNNIDIPLDYLTNLPFPKVRKVEVNSNINELHEIDIENEEGYVIRFLNGFRIKIKFQSYMKNYMLKYYEAHENE
ncbi:MAG: NUDIX domain-containing protein [Bacteroidales bacterium]|nr:NUDIX domain-containing protein [Bacteroidales bacterium]